MDRALDLQTCANEGVARFRVECGELGQFLELYLSSNTYQQYIRACVNSDLKLNNDLEQALILFKLVKNQCPAIYNAIGSTYWQVREMRKQVSHCPYWHKLPKIAREKITNFLTTLRYFDQQLEEHGKLYVRFLEAQRNFPAYNFGEIDLYSCSSRVSTYETTITTVEEQFERLYKRCDAFRMYIGEYVDPDSIQHNIWQHIPEEVNYNDAKVKEQIPHVTIISLKEKYPEIYASIPKIYYGIRRIYNMRIDILRLQKRKKCLENR